MIVSGSTDLYAHAQAHVWLGFFPRDPADPGRSQAALRQLMLEEDANLAASAAMMLQYIELTAPRSQSPHHVTAEALALIARADSPHVKAMGKSRAPMPSRKTTSAPRWS